MKQIPQYKLIILTLFSMLFSSNSVADISKSFSGHQVFNKYCFICHGEQGKGDGPLASKLDLPPSDLTNDNLLSKRTDKELIRIVEGSLPHGKMTDNGSTMPRWGIAISHTQVRSLVAYIRYLHRGKHKLTGDPDSGKDNYDRYCIQCHGDYGEGDGVLTRVYSMEPADHTDAEHMDKVSNKKLRAIITKGGAGASLMPGWSGILSKKEINDVLSYIRLIAAH
ncbi:MAG: c-type cytochrome [Gammaproteobacteria bacterium]|nr:c-type cytochrome [Gammaproteobacteria bacterium]